MEYLTGCDELECIVKSLKKKTCQEGEFGNKALCCGDIETVELGMNSSCKYKEETI